VVFGCADGWIYCLDLTDGSMAWRFLAAPCDRQHVAFEQVESAWPVHGSILIENNIIHAVAGRTRFTDGGMRLLRIDPFTGAEISERVVDERRASDGKPLQENFNEQFRQWKESQRAKDGKRVSLMTFNDVGVSDILTKDGDAVFMRGYRLRFENEEHESRRNSRLKAPWGLIASDWGHRAAWRYATSPHSRILVFNDTGDVFGFGFSIRYQTLLKPFDYYLYGKSLSPGKATDLWPDQKLPLLVRAMILAGDKLIVAGPPDYGHHDKPAAYHRHAEVAFRQQMEQQADAWAGERGGILWVIDAQSGARLSELPLDSPPVFDGMASTSAGIYISTMAGNVVFVSRLSQDQRN
jgi:hypothetical protein